VAARLAYVHLDLLAVHEELAEIAEKESPATASLVKVSLAGESEWTVAADTVQALFSDAAV
jgi:hypothetical protein